MPRLKPTSKKILVSLHILAASIWTGAVAVSLLLSVRALSATKGDELIAFHDMLKWIEYSLIIPPALGSMITGFFLSKSTKWGFFQFRWVTIKWIATIAFILFGAFFLNSWIEGTLAMATKQGLDVTKDPHYQRYANLNLFFVPVQWGVLLFMMILSVFKPWGKSKNRKK